MNLKEAYKRLVKCKEHECVCDACEYEHDCNFNEVLEEIIPSVENAIPEPMKVHFVEDVTERENIRLICPKCGDYNMGEPRCELFCSYCGKAFDIEYV